MKTNLEIVEDCDNLPYDDPVDPSAYSRSLDSLWLFFLPDDSRPHGCLTDLFVSQIPWTSNFRLITSPRKEIHLRRNSSVEYWQSECSWAIDELLDIIRKQKTFPKLGRKRDERFPIIGANFDISIDRAAFSLFGIIGCGVHMTAYTRSKDGEEMKIWIPKRNPNKSTYPSLLDNAVAGGVAVGEAPFECLVREAAEETGLPEDFVRGQALAAGTVTWFNISDERAGGEPGLMNPGLLYVYDLEVEEDFVFRPVDEDDIESFHLMSVSEVMSAMAHGSFKPSSACVMMEFLIRHGFITAGNEKDYAEIVSRLHRRLPFPTRPQA
ncbi:hypothetical protein AJ80_09537 [Polytolypa hystricis UAMH7299]|uniref:Nudix hydrolase domain-containing protein n=1 Tax=Polytolypa hystricis (strain UAMH7299) TaxID=1447883 RepID=A0A2B7WNY8_POLH7|nr:hypothetical protein AJ80_09537 [Polytolypa hystricis UAMH7299]